jgi:[ribosomal protein S5]-alanine N-acetyltransferase
VLICVICGEAKLLLNKLKFVKNKTMQPLNLTPFPELITGRLMLKQLELSDDTAIFTLRSDEKVNQFLYREKAKTIKDAQDFILKINKSIANNESIYWAIKLKENNELIGTICFWNIELKESIVEIGYELLVDYQGKGLMQEALLAAINYGFKIGFKTINACPSAANLPSIKLLERNNFKLIGELKDENELIYALMK